MSVSGVLRLFMSLIYLGCGIFLIAGENIFGFIDIQRYALAGLLILYGSFRMYIFIKKTKEAEEENDEET